jgi:hypothetical protein
MAQVEGDIEDLNGVLKITQIRLHYRFKIPPGMREKMAGCWRATPRNARRTSRSRAASSVPGMRRPWKSKGNGHNHLPGNALPSGTGRTAAEGRSGGCSRQEAARKAAPAPPATSLITTCKNCVPGSTRISARRAATVNQDSPLTTLPWITARRHAGAVFTEPTTWTSCASGATRSRVLCWTRRCSNCWRWWVAGGQ